MEAYFLVVQGTKSQTSHSRAAIGLRGGTPGLIVSSLHYLMGNVFGLQAKANARFIRWKIMTPELRRIKTSEILSRRRSGPTIAPCFVKGTKILMADLTEKNIEEIKIGELVLSVNENNFSIEPDTVKIVTFFKSKKIIKMQLQNGVEIEFTEDHPFWIDGKGWSVFSVNAAKANKIKMEVSKIEKGDFVIVFSNGKLEKVKIMKLFDTGGSKDVYNLHDVSKNSTFFANKTLVHNRNINR